MKVTALKSIRDLIPESLKKYFGSIIRHKLTNNKEFTNTLLSLKNITNENAELVQKNQLLKLKNVLVNAYENVPYYTSLFKNINFNPYSFSEFYHIEKIPFLSKKMIMKNYKNLISRKRLSYYEAYTGGSTGEPLKFLLDYDSIFREAAFVYHFRMKLGYSLYDKLATFRGLNFNGKMKKLNPFYNELVFSPFLLNRLNLKKYIYQITTFEPDFLNGYLSTLYYFAQLLKDEGLSLDIPIKGIFLISENINNTQREFVEKYFQLNTQTFYGHSERQVIGEEVEKNIYNFHPYYGYTEFVNSENLEQEIISTGFLSESMPFIRYQTGDSCQKEGIGYKIFGHRLSEDMLVAANGAMFGHAAFNFHSSIFNKILFYQLFQYKVGRVVMYIVPLSEFTDEDKTWMMGELKKKFGELIVFEIEIGERPILTKNGKFKMINNYLNLK